MIYITKILYKTMRFLIIVLMISITTLILLQILFRFIGIQSMWTTELVRFLFVFLVFFGSSLAISTQEHIIIRSLIDRFSEKIQALLYIVVQLMILIFLYLFLKGNVSLVNSTKGASLTSISWFKMSYVYIGIIVATIIMTVYIVIEIINKVSEVIHNRRKEEL